MAGTSGKTKKNKKKSGTSKTTKSKNTKKKTTNNSSEPKFKSRVKEEIGAFISIAVGAFLIFALFVSAAGKFGEAISILLMGCFGVMAYVLPFYLIVYGILLIAGKTTLRGSRSMIFMVLTFVMLTIINSGRFIGSTGTPLDNGDFFHLFDVGTAGDNGGIIGMYVAMFIVKFLGKAGLYIFSVLALIVLLLLLINTPISDYFKDLNEKRLARKEARDLRKSERAEKKAENDKDVVLKGVDPNETPSRLKNREDRDIKIEGLEKPDSSEQSSSFGSTPSGSRISSNQKNILDIVKNDENYGDGNDSSGFGLEPVNEKKEDVSAIPTSSGSSENTDHKKNDSPKPSVSHIPVAGAGLADDDSKGDRDYELPPIKLLNKGPKSGNSEKAGDFKIKAQKLEKTLQDFKVEASVLKVTVGPTVTRYEVQPSIGVKINSIKSLESDLALNLEVESVRVVPMSSGKVIGIEAYNDKTTLVTLRELIDSPEFRMEESKIAFSLGKNISGHRIIADLKDMPHLLIAGTTGAGKSVCINSILLSILYKAKPSEVKMILVDPKVVELKSYNGIPHLLTPVVTDPDKASAALEYAVAEMNRRYRLFADESVKGLTTYNEEMRRRGELENVLPEVVIVIDELADLMMIAPGKVQESISRLAAMARAAGMHLIVATQQPLASILTSVIKANIPSRIAFKVSSNTASRVILDDSGAERLRGNGDMLFSPIGAGDLERIQGTFVSESEVHKVTDFVKKQMDPEYKPDILSAIDNDNTGKLVEEEDEFFKEAVETVVMSKQASTSMLQRRFRIGYNRAARLMETLETRGVVGPQEGSRARKVLLDEDELDDFFNQGETNG